MPHGFGLLDEGALKRGRFMSKAGDSERTGEIQIPESIGVCYRTAGSAFPKHWEARSREGDIPGLDALETTGKRPRLRSRNQTLFDVFAERTAARRMAQLADGFRFDLADALACHIEDTADFFERAGVSGTDAETQTNDLRFTLAEG